MSAEMGPPPETEHHHHHHSGDQETGAPSQMQQDAVNLLGVTHKAAARHVEKCLKSAIANAENREDHVDVDRLFVKEVFVDGGPMAKRIRPAPMGRAFRILKRQSHITIKLDTRKGPGQKA